MPFSNSMYCLADMARNAMMAFLQNFKHRASLLALCCLAVAAKPLGAQTSLPIEGERLSDWLLRQPVTPNDYSFGLGWQVPSQQVNDSFIQNQLLLQIQLSRVANADHQYAMGRLIKSLPATGRVSLPSANARWLQAHPKADPVLEANQQVFIPSRPSSITMLRQDASWCSLPHQSGWRVIDYLKLCEPTQLSQIDWAWVVQPNGDIQRFGVAKWNAQEQNELAPGAILWAPTRGSGWSDQVSQLLTQFLATQSYDTILQVAASGGTPSQSMNTMPPGAAETYSILPSPAPRNAIFSSNNWGMLGLMQTPSARFGQAGEARFNFSQIYPFSRYNVFLQPFDWLEAGFRYTDIANRLYGPEIAGDQSYKDKSIDFRLRLLEETPYLPNVALGMIDFGGTGLFSSEFLVANKRHGNLDYSLGLAWGNLGSSGNVRNPFTLISDKFNTRGAGVATGGTPNTLAFFRGPAALFGGVQYHTPWDNIIFKAEYDGNNYQNQPQQNNQTQRTPINLGLVYRYHPSLDVSVALERGNAVMLSFTLHTQLNKLSAPKLSDDPTPPVRLARPTTQPLWARVDAGVFTMSRWGVRRISRVGNNTLRIVIEGASGVHWNDRIERIAAALHRDAPAEIDFFELVFEDQGVALSARLINRQVWAEQNTRFTLPVKRLEPVTAQAPSTDTIETKVWERPQSSFSYAFVPSWQQNIGGPDGFVLFQVGLAAPFSWRIRDNLFLAGSLNLRIFDNYDNFKYDGLSNMPRVRTNLRQYTTESYLQLPNLQLTQFGELKPNHYYSLYGGYLEAMFAGVGGEWLYRPWHSPLAFGVDVNYVQQRNFDQFFGFDNAGSQTGYRVATGHATAYWDTPWKSTHARLSVGRYLAKDFGATLDLSRSFDNGVVVGAWVTRTNVSAEEFGEGSFDKGLYLRIPFDVMTTTRSGDAANLVYNPLTRDGGARLNRNFTLHSATRARSQRDTSYSPAN
jgi:hypothetical protein